MDNFKTLEEFVDYMMEEHDLGFLTLDDILAHVNESGHGVNSETLGLIGKILKLAEDYYDRCMSNMMKKVNNLSNSTNSSSAIEELTKIDEELKAEIRQYNEKLFGVLDIVLRRGNGNDFDLLKDLAAICEVSPREMDVAYFWQKHEFVPDEHLPKDYIGSKEYKELRSKGFMDQSYSAFEELNEYLAKKSLNAEDAPHPLSVEEFKDQCKDVPELLILKVVEFTNAALSGVMLQFQRHLLEINQTQKSALEFLQQEFSIDVIDAIKKLQDCKVGLARSITMSVNKIKSRIPSIIREAQKRGLAYTTDEKSLEKSIAEIFEEVFEDSGMMESEEEIVRETDSGKSTGKNVFKKTSKGDVDKALEKFITL